MGEELLELGAELSRKYLVVSKDKGGTVHSCNDVRHGKGLARACYAKQSLVTVAFFYALHKLVDSLGLVARGLIGRNKFKFIHNDCLSDKPQACIARP